MIQGYTLATFPKVTQYILCTTREETGKRTLQNVYNMDNIQDDVELDIENNRTVFLKESDPFLPIIPSPGIPEEPLEERLRTPPATPIHSPHAFFKEDRWLFSPPPVLTSDHTNLDNFETGFNLTPHDTKKWKKSPVLRKRQPTLLP